MLLKFPDVVLDKISEYLTAHDLCFLKSTNRYLREFYSNDRFWKRLMKTHLWTEKLFSTYFEDIMFILKNAPTKRLSSSDFSDKPVRFMAYSNDGKVAAVFTDGCSLRVIRNNADLLNIDMSTRRRWERIVSVAFSPDDKHILVIGTVDQFFFGTQDREALVYAIEEDGIRMRAIIALKRGMLAAWYDKTNIIYMGSRSSERVRFFISAMDITSKVVDYPILTFNKNVTNFLVAQHVSPRTRKIVQISNQAASEGKTIMEKLSEIGAASGVDTTDMSALKAILDQNDECMPCYRLHAHRDSVSATECPCECHHNTDKLLIFYGNDGKVYTKVVTEKTLDDAAEVCLNRGTLVETSDYDRLFHEIAFCENFDTVDYSFNTECTLLNNAVCFSPDHKYFYITGHHSVGDSTKMKLTCIDIETMLLKNTPDFEPQPWEEHRYDTRIAANRNFVAVLSSNNVYVWSKFHQGKPIALNTPLNGEVSAIAMNPIFGELVVLNESVMHVFQASD